MGDTMLLRNKTVRNLFSYYQLQGWKKYTCYSNCMLFIKYLYKTQCLLSQSTHETITKQWKDDWKLAVEYTVLE